jgi:hypothetical protein
VLRWCWEGLCCMHGSRPLMPLGHWWPHTLLGLLSQHHAESASC